MRNCPTCGNQIDDNAVFCPYCGTRFGQAPQQEMGQPASGAMPMNNVIMIAPYDHTMEFDPQDVSDNKVYCMALYLMGVLGVIIGLLAAQKSPYVMFHVRQALKFTVLEILIGMCALVLIWTLIVPIAALIMLAVLWVVRIICFVQICMGKAVEPVIIRSLGFLK